MTRYQYTGQFSYAAEFGLYFYNARWYDPALARFASADILIPEQTQGTQAWDRYAGMNNNPVRYNDPTGHDVCDEEGNCYNQQGKYRGIRRTYSPPSPKPPKPPAGPGGEPACSGTNWSIVCKDPTLISTGQVQTPAVYPTYLTPGTYDGPYADEACASWLCVILLAADAITGIQYKSNIPAHLSDNYAFANVNYEVHSGQFGNYNLVTGLEISNSTNVELTLESIDVGYSTLAPKTQTVIKPDQTLIVPGWFFAGASITIRLTSQAYNPINLLAIFR